MTTIQTYSVPVDYESLVTTDFFYTQTGSAVYMHGNDDLLGPVVAVIYKHADSPKQKLSAIFISGHGVSCFEDMTLNQASRYFGACENLADIHKNSLVRRALAIAALRSYANIPSYNRAELLKQAKVPVYDWDDTVAGSLASSMKLMKGRFPKEIGDIIRRTGILQPKLIKNTTVDLVYEDSDSTIELNNELVYLFGAQMEHLFDPVCEYSPEPAELLYTAPTTAPENTDSPKVAAICNELFMLQTHFHEELDNFLQEFLIPLRVKVLGGEVPDMTIRKLNTIFPPTIEEIVRINKIFHQALEQTLDYGSFEMIKACGMTVPYFYKACMRHEAASQDFSKTLKLHYPALKKYLKKYSARKIESIIHCSIHLTKIKLIMDRLLAVKIQEGSWSNDTLSKAQHYYESAIETIDAFGKVSIDKYRRVFTPTGKMLVEVANNWPKELEYGWVNRRIVSIFDGSSILDDNEEHVIIIFTDYVVVLKKSGGNAATNPYYLSMDPSIRQSVHAPSIADQLFHSLANEKPLDNIPELEVVGWCDSDQVIFSELGETSISMLSKDSRLSLKIYRLDSKNPSSITESFVKAKIMNKCQPFHLFRSTAQDFQCYGTVHEIQDYFQELHKSPIAIFMNVGVTAEILDANNLKAAISVRFVNGANSEGDIRVTAYSKFNYEFDELVSIEEFSEFLLYEIGQLHKLLFSRANEDWRETITIGNRQLAEFLVKYGAKSTSSELFKEKPIKAHENIKILSNGVNSPPQLISQNEFGTPQLIGGDELQPPQLISQNELNLYPSENTWNTEDNSFGSHYFEAPNLSPESDGIHSLVSGIPSPGSAPSLSLSLTDTPPLPSRKSKKSTEHLKARYGNLASDDEDYIDWEDASDSDDDVYDSDGERQQRDVEEWYEALAHDDRQHDLDSLDSASAISIADNADSMYQIGDFDASLRRSQVDAESTPNKEYYRDGLTDCPRFSCTPLSGSPLNSKEGLAPDDTLLYDEDFSYLASYLEK